MPFAARLVLVVVSVGLYLGLAVLGEGSIEPFLTDPPLTALAVATILAVVAALYVGGNVNPGVREDRGNRWVLWAFSLIGIADGFLPAFADRERFWMIDGDTVRWVGVALAILGGALRLWPVHVLGNRFSGLVAIQKDHTLLTTGIYSVIRHPSYLGLLVNMLGWGLAFGNWVGVLLAAVMVPPLVARMNAEERLLQSQFGAEYDAFRARTSRLIPGLY
ncbi:MAG TPA: isoprenylcysteine carboxylmethyltransferase family protein [Alphaproteobacteria bacterium]|nr:isoprenylcysteine carboxylmethyltransferase family protein [Alphaproteobacteria bacterium]